MDIFEQATKVIERADEELEYEEYRGYKRSLKKERKKYLKIIRNQAADIEILTGNIHDLRAHIASLTNQIDGLTRQIANLRTQVIVSRPAIVQPEEKTTGLCTPSRAGNLTRRR